MPLNASSTNGALITAPTISAISLPPIAPPISAFIAKQILALFQNEFYTGPHMVLREKGEPFVRKLIADTFAKWGRKPEELKTENREP